MGKVEDKQKVLKRLQVAYLADSLYHTMTTGITRYTVELARELGQMPGIELRLITLVAAEVAAALAEKRGYPNSESLPLIIPRSLQYLLWHLTAVAGPLSKLVQYADIIHTPTFLVPPRKKIPLVVTVHDLTLLHFPQHFDRKTRLLMGSGLRRAVRDADAFLAVSNYTKQDLVRMTGISPDRVYVTPEAADSRFKPTPDNGALARYGIAPPYVLFVGTLEPRKNIGVLLQAFSALRNNDLTLVLAGTKGVMSEEIFSTVTHLNLSARVKAIGYVADEDLPILYSQAEVFVYPSAFEGFGLPVLEAMQCGVPVVTTNVSSLPEVAGKAAILFAPDDSVALTNILQCILSESSMRDDMRNRSLEQASRFSWQRTAGLTAEVYEHVSH